MGGQETPLGWVPKAGDLDLSGLDVPTEMVDKATDINLHEWLSELESQKEWFDKLGSTVPKTLLLQRDMLIERIKNNLPNHSARPPTKH